MSSRLLVRQFVSRWPSCCRWKWDIEKIPTAHLLRHSPRSLGYRSREIDSRFIRVDESHLPASVIQTKSNLQPSRARAWGDFNSAQLFFHRSETFLYVPEAMCWCASQATKSPEKTRVHSRPVSRRAASFSFASGFTRPVLFLGIGTRRCVDAIADGSLALIAARRMGY